MPSVWPVYFWIYAIWFAVDVVVRQSTEKINNINIEVWEGGKHERNALTSCPSIGRRTLFSNCNKPAQRRSKQLDRQRRTRKSSPTARLRDRIVPMDNLFAPVMCVPGNHRETHLMIFRSSWTSIWLVEQMTKFVITQKCANAECATCYREHHRDHWHTSSRKNVWWLCLVTFASSYVAP